MDWITYLMGFAEHAAKKSKDSTQVGAVLVGRNKEVLLTGYNGPPMGVRDLPDRRDVRPEKYLWVQHAESNLIAFAARNGIRTEGCRVFVTHMPCAHCAKMLIQAGIEQVIVGNGQTSMPADEFRAAETMFKESGVKLMRVE
jgi:dCMP deaminase